jgi:hypothetical protein
VIDHPTNRLANPRASTLNRTLKRSIATMIQYLFRRLFRFRSIQSLLFASPGSLRVATSSLLARLFQSVCEHVLGMTLTSSIRQQILDSFPRPTFPTFQTPRI